MSWIELNSPIASGISAAGTSRQECGMAYITAYLPGTRTRNTTLIVRATASPGPLTGPSRLRLASRRRTGLAVLGGVCGAAADLDHPGCSGATHITGPPGSGRSSNLRPFLPTERSELAGRERGAFQPDERDAHRPDPSVPQRHRKSGTPDPRDFSVPHRPLGEPTRY